MQQQKNINRITAWVVCFATILVMLFSMIFLVEHIDHNCTGNKCSTCMLMEQCQNNLKAISTVVIIASISMFISNEQVKERFSAFSNILTNSPVSQKVRLNN